MADERLRLRVAVTVEGDEGGHDGFELLAQGTAAACLAQLELEVLLRVRAAAAGFRLALGAPDRVRHAAAVWPLAPAPVGLTPARLLEASFWTGRSLRVIVQLLPANAGLAGAYGFGLARVAGLADPAPERHGRWVHAAARRIQSKWRAHRRWRLRVDVADTLHAFAWAVRRRGLRLVHPAALLDCPGTPSAERRMEPALLRLVVALAACRPSPTTRQDQATPEDAEVFRWLEVRSAAFCVHHGAEFSRGLDGLAEPPRCFGALRELTRALMSRLSSAFPWLLERAVVEEAERLAVDSAGAAAKRSRALSRAAARRAFVAQVHSEVLTWVLESAESAIGDLEWRFEDARLAARVADMPCIREVQAALRVLRQGLGGSRPWLVRLKAENGPVLLLPVRAGDHFGGVLRAACAYYELPYAQLFTARGGEEPLRVEQTAAELEARGTFLRVHVLAYAPQPESFDQAVLEIAKALGVHFSLDREARVVRLPRRRYTRKGGAAAGTGILPGDGIVMPECYAGDAQYYHFYDSVRREMLSVRCHLSVLISWLRVLASSAADDPGDFFGLCRASEVNPSSLLDELETQHSQVSHWLWSKVGSHFQRPRRECGSLFSDLDLSQCGPRGLFQEAVARLRPAPPLCLRTSAEPPAAAADAAAAGSATARSAAGGAASASAGGSSSSSSSAAAAAAPPAPGADGSEDEAVRRRQFHAFLCGASPSIGASSSRDRVQLAPPAPAAASCSAGGLGGCLDEAEGEPEEEGLEGDDMSSLGSYLGAELGGLLGAAAAAPPPAPPPCGGLAHRRLGPDVVRPVVLSAAACAAPLLVMQPQSQFVMRQVISIVGNSVSVAPIWPTTLGPGVASLTGAVGGAALGSALGPAGTTLGALLGGVASGKAELWLAHRPQLFDLSKAQSFVLAPSPLGGGKMYLAHKELPHQPGPEGMAIAALAQASLRGCCNLWSYAQGEMSGKDVALAMVKDVRDGALIWASCQGVMKLLTVAEAKAAGGVFGGVCAAALHNPAPVMLGVLGAGWLVVRCVHHSLNRISLDELQADAVLTTSTNVAGIAVNLLGAYLQVPMLGRAALTCVLSQSLGVWTYEAWRARRQGDAEARLRLIACEVLGLAPLHTSEDLHRRWRLLARLSHPDRNKRPDAKRTFAVFSLCRDVLRDLSRVRAADAGGGASGAALACLRGLLRRLRQVPWLGRADLPVPTDLPTARRRHRRGAGSGGTAVAVADASADPAAGVPTPSPDRDCAAPNAVAASEGRWEARRRPGASAAAAAPRGPGGRSPEEAASSAAPAAAAAAAGEPGDERWGASGFDADWEEELSDDARAAADARAGSSSGTPYP